MKKYLYFYVFLIIILLFFITLLFLLNLNLNLTFITNFFAKHSVDIESYIIYAEGNEIYYKLKNNSDTIKYNTKITNGITLETGKDSFIVFYIKKQGIYYVYPESTLYIDKLESFNKEKSIKETHIILEKGKGYFNLNLFSENSNINIETDTISLFVNRGEFFIDKIDNFNTKIYCYDGFLYFRPFSNKFELLKKKKIFNITGSIERLINYTNILHKNESILIDYEMCRDLDTLLSRIYESRNTILIDREYITRNLIFNKNTISENENIDIKFNFEEKRLNMYGYLELKIPNIKYNIFFNDREIKNNNRYIFFLQEGIYKIASITNWTTIIEYLEVKRDTVKEFSLTNYTGIKNFLVNNKRVKFESLNSEDIKKIFKILYKKNNNFQLIRWENLDENISSIYIKADVSIKNIHFFKNSITNSNEYMLENNEKKYYSFPVRVYGENEISINNIDFEFSKDIIIVEYNERYEIE